MEKKKVTKVTESQLVGLIYEGLKQTLKEYRGDDYMNRDGDRYYTRPNGETNFRKSQYDSKMGKRALGNANNSLDGTTYKTYGPLNLSHGKGNLCYEVMKFIEKKFQINSDYEPIGKIEWTENELELIKKINSSLYELARLSKKEGNKKRGYDGPSED